MKIIDLLQKIWKDELSDKTKVIFKEHNTECIFHKNERRFEFVNKGDWNDYFNKFTLNELDNEVEIIEEKPKKIEKIKLENGYIIDWDETGKHFLTTNRKDRNLYIAKLNEIIDNLNYLLEKSDSE